MNTLPKGAARLLIEILGLLVLVEVSIMLVLPRVAGSLPDWVQGLLDAMLLCIFLAPWVLWRARSFEAALGKLPRISGSSFGQIYFLPLAIAVVGSCGAVLAGWQFHAQATRDRLLEFERRSAPVRWQVQAQLDRPGYGIRGLAATLGSNPLLTREAFRDWIARRDLAREFPGLRGFGWIEPVRRQDSLALVLRIRSAGAPQFQMHSTHTGDSLFPIVQIEPLERNAAALGYDVGSEAHRLATARRALREEGIFLSPPIALVQDRQMRRGALLMRGIDGKWIVSAPLVYEELLGALDSGLFRSLHAGLVDLEDPDMPLWSRGTKDGIGDLLVRADTLERYGRRLVLRCSMRADALEILDVGLPVGVVGVLVSVLIALMTASVATARRRTDREYRKALDDLEVSERQTRSALREAQTFRGILEEASIISLTDRAGNIVSVNDAFCAISGYSREELLGKNHRIVNSGKHGKEFWAQMWEKVSKGRVWREVVCNRRKDGALYWVDSIVAPFHDENGKVETYLSVRFDVTDRMLADQDVRETKEVLQSVLDSALNVGIVATDPSGRVTVFSKGAQELLGHDPEEVEFLQTPMLWHDAQEVEARRAELSEVAGRELTPFEAFVRLPSLGMIETRTWTFRRLDGSTFPGRLSASAIQTQDGRIRGYLGLFEDISQELADKRELELAKELAEEATRAKSRFLASMSHELRTPMNGIIGVTDILLDGRLDAEQRGHAQIVRSSAVQLLTLLNDILDSSKIEAGKLELETVEFALPRMLHELRSLLGVKAKEKGIALEIRSAPVVPAGLRGDPVRLRQILLNLIGNALKFTDRGGVTVKVGGRSEGEDAWRLRVEIQDTGIGMTPQQQAKLFGEYAQAEAGTARRYGGTGLGLSISRRLVELMDGEIGVESVEGTGSTFWFEVPMGVVSMSELPMDPMPPPGQEQRRFAGSRVLVADDNAVNLMVAQALLRKLGIEPETVADGETALARLKEADFDLVLMDMQMDGLDGPAATRRLRAGAPNGRNSMIPVVALTAAATSDEKEICREAGMNDHLSKPLMIEDLARVLGKLLPEG